MVLTVSMKFRQARISVGDSHVVAMCASVTRRTEEGCVRKQLVL
jgi:hypothetical protein